jgi:hypothetical protein
MVVKFAILSYSSTPRALRLALMPTLYNWSKKWKFAKWRHVVYVLPYFAFVAEWREVFCGAPDAAGGNLPHHLH